MKTLKKIMASGLALVMAGAFVFGGYTEKPSQIGVNVSYADTVTNAQREQLKIAVDDASYVRSTKVYKNADPKDVSAYEVSVKVGQTLLNNPKASKEDLYNATKSIDLRSKYLTTSANIVYISAAIEKSEETLMGLDYIEKKMPNAYKRYEKELSSAKKSVEKAIADAKHYINTHKR